ncbi:MAG: hypothetical protein R2844_16180 [Caldilineales bacterium]
MTGTTESRQQLRQHVQPAAAVAPQRVGRVGDILHLVEDESGNQHRPGNEACLADVGDAAIDDDAAVQQDRLGLRFRLWFFLLGTANRKPPTQQVGDVVGAQHHDRYSEISEHDRADGGQDVAEGRRQLRKRQRQQCGDNQPNDQTNTAIRQLLYRQLAYDPPHRTRRLGGEIGRHDRADHSKDQRHGHSPLQCVKGQI